MALPITNGQLTTVGNATLTGTLLANSRFITRTGPSAGFTDTTDTATNIIAQLAGLTYGTNWTVEYINESGQTATLAAGVGVTLDGEFRSRAYRTNCSHGSDHVFLHVGGRDHGCRGLPASDAVATFFWRRARRSFFRANLGRRGPLRRGPGRPF